MPEAGPDPISQSNFWYFGSILHVTNCIDLSKASIVPRRMASRTPDGQPIDPVENRRRMENGELYYCFTPELMADRKRCALASRRYNSAGDVSRRKLIELWKE